MPELAYWTLKSTGGKSNPQTLYDYRLEAKMSEVPNSGALLQDVYQNLTNAAKGLTQISKEPVTYGNEELQGICDSINFLGKVRNYRNNLYQLRQ